MSSVNTKGKFYCLDRVDVGRGGLCFGQTEQQLLSRVQDLWNEDLSSRSGMR